MTGCPFWILAAVNVAETPRFIEGIHVDIRRFTFNALIGVL